ncbi:hypothetical protein HMPREF9374_1713 [Desmospora sp. 8437]|nr:hypothetical protein HMPREF9374_1713 [Desmospora sp. 8437]
MRIPLGWHEISPHMQDMRQDPQRFVRGWKFSAQKLSCWKIT